MTITRNIAFQVMKRQMEDDDTGKKYVLWLATSGQATDAGRSNLDQAEHRSLDVDEATFNRVKRGDVFVLIREDELEDINAGRERPVEAL